MIYGLDLLGGARYPEIVLQNFPEAFAFGIFFDVDGFGESVSLLQKLCKTGRAPVIRVQLKWRDAHNFTRSDFPEIIKRATRIERMAVRYPNIRFYISGACEHNFKKKDAQDLADLCRRAAPHCFYVNNPSHHFGGEYIPATDSILNECHGHQRAPSGKYIYSFDGTACVDSNVPEMIKTHQRAEVFFFWTYQFNLNRNGKKEDVLPRAKRKAAPTPELIDSVIYLHRPKGETNVPQRYTLKSHSDQHTNGLPESRALKPVYILPLKTDRIEMVADNGQVIAISEKAQPYDADNRWRYYFSTFGYQLAEKARRIQGHPVVGLKVGGKIRARINPAHRDGDFRK